SRRRPSRPTAKAIASSRARRTPPPPQPASRAPPRPPRPPPASDRRAGSPPRASFRATMSDGFARLLPRGRWLWVTIVALVLLLAGAALGAYLYERNRTGNVYHPNARFIPQPTPTLPAKVPDRFSWPLYGYTKNHTRFFPAGPHLRPP